MRVNRHVFIPPDRVPIAMGVPLVEERETLATRMVTRGNVVVSKRANVGGKALRRRGLRW